MTKTIQIWYRQNRIDPQNKENKSFIPHDRLHKDKHSANCVLSNSLSQRMFFWFSSTLFNLSCKKQSLIELSRRKNKKVMVLGMKETDTTK